MVKNLPCNEGDMGSIPGQGTKIPPAATTEPVGHNEKVLAPQEKNPHDTMQIPHASTKIQRSQRKKERMISKMTLIGIL